MMTLNRRNIVYGLTEDLVKSGQVNLEDLNQADPTQKWKQKRKKMTNV
jgi:hypothetical protein